MGLLFRVNGVSQLSPTFEALSVIMVLLVAAFIVAWLLVAASHLRSNLRRSRTTVAAAKVKRSTGSQLGSVTTGTTGDAHRAAVKASSQALSALPDRSRLPLLPSLVSAEGGHRVADEETPVMVDNILVVHKQRFVAAQMAALSNQPHAAVQ